ncbi:hypothetical protein BC940DRAFT_297037 [Gongronella butleri]|nr:hypothetical protein BC940DRAFT_297037 [Gongronella butleri]
MALSIQLASSALDPLRSSRLQGYVSLATAKRADLAAVDLPTPPADSPSSSPTSSSKGTFLPCMMSCPVNTCVQFVGEELVLGNAMRLIDDTYRLSTDEWTYDYDKKQWCLHFDIPLPCLRDLPISFAPLDHRIPSPHDDDQVVRGHPLTQDQQKNDNGDNGAVASIQYHVRATARYQNTDLQASAPVTVQSPRADTTHDAKPMTKTCWGMSEHKHWLYELELPQWVEATKPFNVGIRTKSRSVASSNDNATCMITIQLYEAVKVDTQPETTMTLLTSSHLLKNPSTTWSSPCTVPLELLTLPSSGSLSSPRIHISHHLCVTLRYYSPEQKQARQLDAIHYRCMVPVFAGPCSSKQQDSDRDSGISMKSC